MVFAGYFHMQVFTEFRKRMTSANTGLGKPVKTYYKISWD